MSPPDCEVLVVGGGPAGLRAAEVASAAGARVMLCDAQPSVGRKFLVAGRGGLNLTHGEPLEEFPQRYGADQERWRDLLSDFGPDDLRRWAAEIGTETYVGTSGRVFPRGQKAAALLRAWVHRLRASRVQFRARAKLSAIAREEELWRTEFVLGESEKASVVAHAVVLALGGASWPETGSDGRWPRVLQEHGIDIAPWAPANCGWEVEWPNELLERAEGMPLKNLTVSAEGERVSGELLITRYGLEGGAIYRLTPQLRAMQKAAIVIDLKPQVSADVLLERLAQATVPWAKVLKLSPAAAALLENFCDVGDREALVRHIKRFELPLLRPRPIEEAISSAGGVRWRELDAMLMLRKLPGVFVAGEMIDWEAPTGGYLLQGCFATGTRAGRGASAFVRKV